MIEHVAGKAKLSQNRSEADRQGVVEGLRSSKDVSEHAIADAMAARLAE